MPTHVRQQQLLTAELKQQLHSKVLACYNLAETYFLTNFARPEVLINLRGSSAGVAELKANRLRFNPILLAENQTEFIQQVVPHEVAHLLAWRVYGRGIKPHGWQWQQIMQEVFDLEALTTHSFCIKQAAKQHYIYSCGCLNFNHHFTKRRHNLVLAGRHYICKKCANRLVFKGLDQGLISNCD